MTSTQSPEIGDPDFNSGSDLLALRVDVDEREATVSAAGEIDCSSAASLTAAIEHARTLHPNIAVDMERVGFMDSAGLGTLIRALKISLETGASFSVRNPSPTVLRVLDITGQTSRFVGE